MTNTTMVRALAAKELRVLAPVWLGTAAAMIGLGTTSQWRGIGPLGAAAYALGCVALGAMSLGHEFRHATMAALLAAPVRRDRVLATKLGVLALLLATLGVLAWASGGSVSAQNSSIGSELLRSDLWFILPLLCGIGLAPWFTLLCRSEIAGMAFAGAVPALLLIGGDVLALMAYGLTPDRLEESRALKWLVVEVGTLTTCSIGVAGSVRAFRRLELLDQSALDTWSLKRGTVASSATRLASRRRNPWVALAAKELRLQSPVFAVAALFVVAWLAASLAGESVVARVDLDSLRSAMTMFYVATILILTGALGSAEERQRGTLSAQLLVPMTMWKQWSVKVGVIVGLAVVLAVLLPLLLTAASATPRTRAGMPLPLMLTIVPGLPLFGLYVSSRTASGLQAFLVAVGIAIGLWVTTAAFYVDLMRPLAVGFASLVRGLASAETLMAARAVTTTWIVSGMTVVLLFLLVRLAMVNHRSMDRDAGTLGRQVGWFVATLTGLMLCTAVAGGLWLAAVEQRRGADASAVSTE